MSETIEAIREYEDFNGALEEVNVLVLGRGVNTLDDLQPEDITEGSLSSAGSYRRAVAGAELTNELNDADYNVRFVASGRRTFFMPRRLARDNSTEARGILNVAMPLVTDGERTRFFGDSESQSTFDNYLQTLKQGWINPEGLTVVVTEQDHKDRALRTGRFIMPHAALIGHIADPENAMSTDHSDAEKMAERVYALAMRGVEPGDIASIQRRDKAVQLVGQAVASTKGLFDQFSGSLTPSRISVPR